ncbi:MAG: hypothetical protein FWC55_10510 [Firmicutes bacterium]|nr:hypothetical protein [Bacillota bacterium]
MNRSNVLVLGVILVLVGIFSAAQRFFTVHFWHAALLAGGFAFLMLYQGKRKTWSLALGLYLLGGGAVAILSGALPGRVTAALVWALFFIAPGVTFLTRFYARGRRGALYAASFLLWFGLFTVLAALPAFKGAGAALFLACAGCSFLFVYFAGGRGPDRGALYAGACLLVLGAVRPLTRLPLPGFVSALAAAAGLCVIGYSLRKSRRRGGNEDNDPD